MISGLVLKYLNGSRFVMREGYETAPPRLKARSSDNTHLPHSRPIALTGPLWETNANQILIVQRGDPLVRPGEQ